jgi:hydroxymethylbilane synthase
MRELIRIGTRRSALARWQTDYVAEKLGAAWPGTRVEIEVIVTQGDRVQDTPLPLMGGKGVFTAELEQALHSGSIDLAVHSLKDLPTENPAGLTIGATPERATVNDALISRNGYHFRTLPQGATVGTSSRRRGAQLLALRPDLRMIDIRGNVDTRIRKALDPEGGYDAIMLAAAGLERLGLMHVVQELIPTDDLLPAPGQAALGIQCRDEADSLALLAPLNHLPTQIAVTAERAFLAGLGGGCALPIAAYAHEQNGRLSLRGRASAPDGSAQIDVHGACALTLADAFKLGQTLAQEALGQGAAALVELPG